MNLIETILKLLGSGSTLGKIAAMLGIGQDQAGKAVNAAVPSLLASLIGVLSKPDGASQLSQVVSRQDPSALDNLSGFLTQGANAGTSASNPLASLLGGGVLNQLSGVLAKFTGVNEGGAGKLIGMLAPVVLGAVGKQAKGMDASGLAAMLAGQKAHVKAALPAGLENMLGSALPGLDNILGSASGVVASAADATSAAARSASSAARGAVQSTTAAAQGAARQVEATGSSVFKWLVPVILVVLLLLFLPRLLRKAPEAGPGAASSTEVGGAAPQESTTLVQDVTGMIGTATKTISSIRDEATAKAALPRLEEINTKLAQHKTLWARLPASVQTSAAESLRPLAAKLREAVQPVLLLPVVGETLKPVVNQMLTSLETFTGTGVQ